MAERAIYPQYVGENLNQVHLCSERPTVLELLGDITGKKIVDVGCGSGFLTRVIAQMVGIDGFVLGLDISEKRIKQAKRILNPLENTSYVVASSQNIPEENFDAAVLSRVVNALETQDEVKGTFKDIARVMKPGGNLVVSLPDLLDTDLPTQPILSDGDKVVMNARSFTGETKTFSHTFWSLDKLIQLASEAGLAHVIIKHVDISPDEDLAHEGYIEHPKSFNVIVFQK